MTISRIGLDALMIKFAGPLEELEEAIDFGTVTKRDDAQRQLHVSVPKK